jgi:hypothetical protein
MCSYMAMFPPKIPRYFIERCTAPGDIVLDPFSGRGTVPLEACLDGRVGVGNDLNPLAYVLTSAKVNIPDRAAVLKRLDDLASGYEAPPEAIRLLDEYRAISLEFVAYQQAHASGHPPVPQETWERTQAVVEELRVMYSSAGPSMPFFKNTAYCKTARQAGDVGFSDGNHHPVWVFFHPETLRQLCYLRDSLAQDEVDGYLRAVTLGIMHGRGRFYLSIPMPNTFSQTPNYVLSYAYRNRLVLPLRDVFKCLREKIELMGFPPVSCRGAAILGDVRNLAKNLEPVLGRRHGRPKLVVSSPPYLGVVKYGQYNWIRLWFLENESALTEIVRGASVPEAEGGTPPVRLDQTVDRALDDGHRRLEPYLVFMKAAMEQVYEVIAPGGICAFVIGDVDDHAGQDRGAAPVLLAGHVLNNAAIPAGFLHLGTVEDVIPEHSKVSKIWSKKRGRATTIDRVLVLRKPG